MKEDNKIYIIIICIMGAIILGLIYFCFFSDIFKDYKNTKKKAEGIIDKVTEKMDEQLDKIDDEDKNNTISNNNSNDNKKYCEGTYYGKNSIGTTESEYKLNKDGTYTVNHNNLHKFNGYYVIIDNTITFIQPKEIYGVGNEINHYDSSSMYIDSDCKYFIGNVDNTEVKYEKK